MSEEIRDKIEQGERIASSFIRNNFRDEKLPEDSPVSVEEIINGYKFYKKIETNKEFDIIKNRIFRKRNLFIRSVSIAASIAILISLLVLNNVFIGEDTYEANFYENNRPGSSSAVLILPDKSVVDLNNKDSVIKEMNLIAYRDSSSMIFISEENESKTDEVSEFEFNEIKVPRGGEYNFKLSDGTIVYLNSESSIKFPVRFSEQTRNVYVKGEAIFEVSHDKSRPFIVTADEVSIKVLGTVFNVRSFDNEKRTVVTLNEGSVQIIRKDKVITTLAPEEQITIKENEYSVSNVDSRSILSWKDGVFRFNEEPLSYVLAQIGRWYNCSFDIDDKLQNRKYTGIINKYDSIEEFISVLRTTGEFEIVFNKDISIGIYSINKK